MDERLVLLKELCDAFGPSGCEGNVADIIIEKLDGLADEIKKDRTGCVTAVYRGKNGDIGSKRLQIDAHMDEVGFMVTHIDDDGAIRFRTVGGIDARVICGRRVVFGDENKKIEGIVASKAIHQQSASERKEATGIESMYVDIGAKNKDEALKYVEPGDFGTFVNNFVLFGNKMLRSKALDDRLGCAVLIETIKKLKSENIRFDFDIYFVFSVREELGKAGAITSAYSVNPDKAIVIEATAVADIADVPENSTVAKTGEGGAVSLLDVGTIYDRDFIEFIMKTGKDNGIKCQYKRYVSGSNNAAHIQRTHGGVSIAAISAPTRYIHTPSNVINTDDYYSVTELLYTVIKNIEI